jgi:radical SAM-linked protein
MKISFGPALPVGTGSEREYLDVWLTMYTKADEALRRLSGAATPDLAPNEVRFVGEREPALGAAATIALYRVGIAGTGVNAQTAQAAFDEFATRGTLTVEHKGKQKVFDLSRALPKEVRVRSDEGDKLTAEMAVRMGQEGSLRPEVLTQAALRAAGLEPAVTVVTRLDTLIEEDEGVWSRPI